MDIRRFAPLRAAGATWKEIAAEAGCDWRTARKYLSEGAPVGPPRAPLRAGTQPRLVDPFVELIDTWLVTEPRLRASVIHERLVADYGFTGHYQRIKNYVRDARGRLELAADPSGRPPALAVSITPSSPQSTWACAPATTSPYSVAARGSDGRVTKAGQHVEVRLEATELVIRRLPADSPAGTALELGRHPRVDQRGQRVVEPAHWAELPDGHTRATIVEPTHATSDTTATPQVGEPTPTVRTEARAGFDVEIVHRPLTDYDALAGLAPPRHEVSKHARSSALVGAA